MHAVRPGTRTYAGYGSPVERIRGNTGKVLVRVQFQFADHQLLVSVEIEPGSVQKTGFKYEIIIKGLKLRSYVERNNGIVCPLLIISVHG